MISIAIPFADRSPETLKLVCDNLLFCGADEVVIGNIGQSSIGNNGLVKELHVNLGCWLPSLARNMAAMATRGDKIVFALADTFCATPEKLRQFADVPAGVVRTAKDCIVLNAEQSKAAMQGERSFKRPERYKDGFLIGALMAINRSDFFDKVRGWDPEQVDWGYNDRDFLARCQTSGLKHEIFDIQMIHLWHERRPTSNHDKNEQASKQKLGTDWWGYQCA